MERLLNIIELSNLLSVKQSTIYDWVHKDLIPHIKLNRLVRFRESEINEWLKTKNSRKHKIKSLVEIN
jgi:excisionase family DNA binding protein